MKHFAAIWLLSFVAFFIAAPTSDAGLISQSSTRHYITAAAGAQDWADVYISDVSTIGPALATDGQTVGIEVGGSFTGLSQQLTSGNGATMDIVSGGSFDGNENAVRIYPPTATVGSGDAEYAAWLRFLDLWDDANNDIAQVNFRVLVYYGPRYFDLAPNAKSWGFQAQTVLATSGGDGNNRSGVFDNRQAGWSNWKFPFVTVETFSIYCNPYDSGNFHIDDCVDTEKLIEIRGGSPNHSASPPQTGGEWICFEHIFDTRQNRGNANGLVKLLVWTRDGLVSEREVSGPLTHNGSWSFSARYIYTFEGLGFYFNDAGTANADNYVMFSHATFAANMTNTDTLIGPPPGFVLNYLLLLAFPLRAVRRLGLVRRVLRRWLLIVGSLVFALPAHAELVLRQSTASQAVMIGPFVDSTDGNTAETGLTIDAADVRLSKNGANIVGKNSGGCTHDEIGYYTCTFDATDTNTVGRLQIMVHESGARPVYHEFSVAEEAIYDACCESGATVAAADGSDFDAIPWNASWDAEAQSEATDALNAYDPPTRAELTSDINAVPTAVRSVVVEDQGSITLGCAIAALLAVNAGDVSTSGGNSTFEDASGTETRVASVVVTAGNRTTTITCPTY